MTFKIGDWVSYDNGFKDVLFQIKEFECYGIIKHNSKRIKEQYLKLWKPSRGEWCWFWSDDMQTPVLDNFVYSKVDNTITFIELNPNPYVAHILDKAYQYCEPFIGELPSYIKDIHGTK